MLLMKPEKALSMSPYLLVHCSLHTGTKLNTERLPCPQYRIADSYSGGFLVHLDSRLVRVDTDDL